jgi:hypothetical protein
MAVALAIEATDREPRRFVPHAVSVGPAPVHSEFATKKYINAATDLESDLSPLVGRQLRVRFIMQQADLYFLQFM